MYIKIHFYYKNRNYYAENGVRIIELYFHEASFSMLISDPNPDIDSQGFPDPGPTGQVITDPDLDHDNYKVLDPGGSGFKVQKPRDNAEQ